MAGKSVKKAVSKPKISPAPIVAVAQKITAPKATKTAKSNVKFDIEKYVSTDELRPVINCVYYDNDDKVAVATDVYVLVYSKELYNPKYAGKMIAARDIWKGKGMKNARIEYAKGTIVDGKYPNWKAVITKNNKLAVKINTQKLYDFVVDCEKTIKEEIKKINDKIDQRLKNGESKYIVGKHINAKFYLEESEIVFLYNGKYFVMVSLLKLKKFVAAMLFLGTDTLYFDAENPKYSAIMTYNSNGGALIMPKVFDDKDIILNIKYLIKNTLEPAYNYIPFKITSVYRSPALNTAVGSKTNKSQHLKGEAADITTGSIADNKKIYSYIRENLPFDQLIAEYGYKTIHVSLKRNGINRKQTLYTDDLINYKTI